MDSHSFFLVPAALFILVLAAHQTASLPISEEEVSASAPSVNLILKNVTYSADVPLKGYLTYDERITAPRPGIVVFPDWDGIGGYEHYRAKVLAALGYIVFVGDLYGSAVHQGPSLSNDLRAQYLQQLVSHPTIFRGRMLAALAELREVPNVDTTKLGAVGYCLGGTGIVELARAYPNGTDGLSGVVGFHAGKLDTEGSKIVTDAPIEILLLQGGSDPTIVGRAEFLVEMKAANIEYKIIDYAGSFHAYTEPSVETYGSNPQADDLSWSAMRSFLDDHVGAVTPFHEDATDATMSDTDGTVSESDQQAT